MNSIPLNTGRSSRTKLLWPALRAILLCLWAGAGITQAATADAVVAWGAGGTNHTGNDVDYGQSLVPLAAQSGVVAIAAGGAHTAALKQDGSVIAWGDNRWGQVDAPPGLIGVTAIAAGNAHTLALKADGSLVGWGDNGWGQATAPADLTGLVAIAAGYSHTLVLKRDGSVAAWGVDYQGQVTGTRTPVGLNPKTANPVTLNGQVLSGVKAVAAGANFSLALTTNGSVVAWGDNSNGETAVPPAAQSGVTAISAGYSHAVALKSDGSLVAWGSNGQGQIDVPAAARNGVVAIAAGGNHTVALKSDGSLIAWGFNGYGQTALPIPAQSGVTAIAAGLFHTAAIVHPASPEITMQPESQTADVGQSVSFSLAAAGYPLFYQWRKDGMNLPGATNATFSLLVSHIHQAGSYTAVVSNSAGTATSAPAMLTVNAVTPGTVVVWGDGLRQSGATVIPPSARSGVTAVAAGGSHFLALKEDGSAVAWGGNQSGQSTVPPGLPEVVAVAAGDRHSVALQADGSVVTWGSADFGLTDVPLAAQSGVIAIAAGTVHTVALKSDGSVVAWGYDGEGQTIVPVEAQSGVTAIAAGFRHTVALKSDGSVVAWGANWSGQLNVPVAARSGVTAIAAGMFHTLALKGDGSVVAWGANFAPQIAVPSGLRAVEAIAAGGGSDERPGSSGHSVALLNDGSVVAWGSNASGQLAVPSGLSEVTAIAAGHDVTVAIIGTRRPFLNARRSGNKLILSWPAHATGFTLQSTPRLALPLPWTGVTPPPAVNGTEFTITTPTSGAPQFFRLIKTN